jgi:hypothetical protein
MSIKQKIEVVRESWTWNHKRDIVIMVLMVALYGQVNIDRVRELVAFDDKVEATVCDILCEQRKWVDTRAAEILAQNMPSHTREAQYTALIELNEMSTELAGTYTHASLKRAE